LSLDLKKNKIIKKWYINQYLEKFTLKKLFYFKSIFFYPFKYKLFNKIYFKIIKKKILNLSEKDILLLGPYANNHFHILNDFILRIFLIDNKKIKNVYLPDECKKYIITLKLDKLLKLKFIYLSENKNYIFNNAKYLSHLESRINNLSYKNCINRLKKFLVVKKTSKKLKVLISRENTNRKILNEGDLFNQLQKKNFIKVNFEKISLKKQIFYCLNASVIIGYHGAGIVNPIFFGNKKLLLIEILNENYKHIMYEKISKIVGLNYKSFICKGRSVNLDCYCDIREILNYINELNL